MPVLSDQSSQSESVIMQAFTHRGGEKKQKQVQQTELGEGDAKGSQGRVFSEIRVTTFNVKKHKPYLALALININAFLGEQPRHDFEKLFFMLT